MADSPIAYSPAQAPRAHGRYSMSTGGQFFDTTAVAVQFKQADYEENIGQYLTFDGAAYTWTALVDCTVAIDLNLTIKHATELDNRSTAQTYINVNGSRVSESNQVTYHRLSNGGVLNDHMTCCMNINLPLNAGDVVQFLQVRIAGGVQLVSTQYSSVSMEILSGLISSAGFIPPGTGVTQGETLRWNGVNWEVTNELTTRDDGKIRGLIDTTGMPAEQAYTKINTNFRVLEELPAGPGYNTLYFIVDPI